MFSALSLKISFLCKHPQWWDLVKGQFDLLANATKYIYCYHIPFHFSPACLAGGVVPGGAVALKFFCKRG